MSNRRMAGYILIIVTVMISVTGNEKLVFADADNDKELSDLQNKYDTLTEQRDKITKESVTIIVREAITENNQNKPIYRKSINQDRASGSLKVYKTTGTVTNTDKVINDLFTIMAEIAVDKAKSNTLNIIIKKVQKIFDQNKLSLNFPETKRIIDSLTVSGISSSSQSLVNAFIADIGTLMETHISDKDTFDVVNSKDVKQLFKLFYSIMVENKNEPIDLMHSFGMTTWSDDKINIIIIAIRILEKMPDKSPEDVADYIDGIVSEYYSIQKKAIEKEIISKSELLTFLRNYYKTVKDSSSEKKVRLKAFSDFSFGMLRIVLKDEIKSDIYINVAEQLINSRIDNNNREFVASVFNLIELTLRDYKKLNLSGNQLYQIYNELNSIVRDVQDIQECNKDEGITTLKKTIKDCMKNVEDIEKNIKSAFKDLRQVINERDLKNIEKFYYSYNDKYKKIKTDIKSLNDNVNDLQITGIECIKNDKYLQKKISNAINSIKENITEFENKFDKCIANYDSKLEPVIKEFKRIKPLVTAITAYTETYSDDSADKENIKEIRKQIVENLITETTNRYQRYDEWIFSLGINTGFLLPVHTRDGSGIYPPFLSLPLGFYLQYMPDDSLHCYNFLPNHFGFYFFDLGQYLFYDENSEVQDASWENAFTIGAQVGWFIFSTPDMLYSFGFDIRYSPALHIEGESKKDDIWAGVYVSYYVSFFDFN